MTTTSTSLRWKLCQTMEGIYTTCVVPETLDESPMAYKSMAEIIDQI